MTWNLFKVAQVARLFGFAWAGRVEQLPRCPSGVNLCRTSAINILWHSWVLWHQGAQCYPHFAIWFKSHGCLSETRNLRFPPEKNAEKVAFIGANIGILVESSAQIQFLCILATRTLNTDIECKTWSQWSIQPSAQQHHRNGWPGSGFQIDSVVIINCNISCRATSVKGLEEQNEADNNASLHNHNYKYFSLYYYYYYHYNC